MLEKSKKKKKIIDGDFWLSGKRIKRGYLQEYNRQK